MTNIGKFQLKSLNITRNKNFEFSDSFFSGKKKFKLGNDYVIENRNKILKIKANNASLALKLFSDEKAYYIKNKNFYYDDKILSQEILQLLKTS